MDFHHLPCVILHCYLVKSYFIGFEQIFQSFFGTQIKTFFKNLAFNKVTSLDLFQGLYEAQVLIAAFYGDAEIIGG